MLIIVATLSIFFKIIAPFFIEINKRFFAGFELQKISKKVMFLYQQGNYAAAIPLAQKAIKISRKALGSQNAHVATYLNSLAELYRCQGRYAEAEPR